MSVTYPEATSAYGNTAVAIVTTVAVPTAADLSTEVNAATSLTNFACYLYGTFESTAETNKGTAPARVCDDEEREVTGRTIRRITDIEYLHDPQAADAATNNEARELLVTDVELWLLERQGLSAKNTAWAVGQHYIAYHVKMGIPIRSRTGTGEFDEYSVKQSLDLLSPPVNGVIVA